MSMVMTIDECPSRSWTILGWMLAASMWLAWLCRSLCSVTFHSFRKAETPERPRRSHQYRVEAVAESTPAAAFFVGLRQNENIGGN
jgi:hypothetical protein